MIHMSTDQSTSCILEAIAIAIAITITITIASWGMDSYHPQNMDILRVNINKRRQTKARDLKALKKIPCEEYVLFLAHGYLSRVRDIYTHTYICTYIHREREIPPHQGISFKVASYFTIHASPYFLSVLLSSFIPSHVVMPFNSNLSRPPRGLLFVPPFAGPSTLTPWKTSLQLPLSPNHSPQVNQRRLMHRLLQMCPQHK